MGILGDRISGFVEDRVVAWRERLGGWTVTWLSKALEGFLHLVGIGLKPILLPQLREWQKDPDTPPYFKAILDRWIKEDGEWQAALGWMMAGNAIGGAASASMTPLLEKLKQKKSKQFPFQLLPISALLMLKYRKLIPEEDYIEHFKRFGFGEPEIDWMEKSFLYYPSPGELVNWQAKEVFEPTMIEKYGLDAELEEIEREPFYRAGMTDEQIRNFWRAHWVHASWGQVLDMYHRGLITYDDVERWFRVVEVPPYWRDKLIGISWSLPNRIETRMMARYGLVDHDWLVKHLERIGLHEDYRSIAADFMLAMGIRMDVAARYSKGWLTADEVKSEIATFGMSEDINDRLYKWIVKNVGPEKVEDERNLTKTEIYAGVKKEVITWDEGLELLQDMGYGPEDAQYILEVRVGALAGSPESFMELKQWTQGYRRAQGMEYKIPPAELIAAGKALKEAETARKEAIDKGIKEEKLAPYEKAVSDAQYRYRQLLTKWKEEAK